MNLLHSPVETTRYGAFREDRALLLNGSVDVRLTRSWDAGLRAAWMNSPGGRRAGTAFTMGTLWNGVATDLGLAWPVDDVVRGRWNRTLVVAEVTAAFVR